jgi:integrase
MGTSRLETILVGLNPKTIRHYDVVLSSFKRVMGKPLEKASVGEILRFINWGMKSKKWSKRTVLNYMTVIRSYLSYVGRDEEVGELKKHARKFSKMAWVPKVNVVLSKDDVIRMINAVPRAVEKYRIENGGDYVPLIWLLYTTGLRLSEALSIRVKDVNLEERTVLPERRKFGEVGGEEGKVVISKSCARLLHKLIEMKGLGPEDRVFSVAPRTFQLNVKLIAKEAGIHGWKNVHPHLFRHVTSIVLTHALREGKIDIETLRGQMGWRNPTQMLSVYSNFGIDVRRQIIDGIFK